MNNKNTLMKTGKKGDYDVFTFAPGGIKNVSGVDILRGDAVSTDLTSEVSDPQAVSYSTIKIGRRTYQYASWGDDDQLPFRLVSLLRRNMVTAQCMQVNTLCTYSQGIIFAERESGKRTDDPAIREFCIRNNLHELYLHQATDMQHFSIVFTLLQLSRDGSKIVNIHHREACYCRLEKAGKDGVIRHVIYGNWRDGQPTDPKIYELLNMRNPLGDLLVRMGKVADPATGEKRKPTSTRCFCVVSRMPTPCYQYYPVPYYAAMFCDDWYDIYRAISVGKLAMIRNTSAPRVQIEIHRDYFQSVFMEEGIIDLEEQRKRKEELEDDIINYVCGAENAGKGLVTHYFIDPNGKENRMVRIINLNEGTRKEGGDWADDMCEASNALCFCMGVHPNLVGATPGKSQMNNSGSDKRELFTLKQVMLTPFREVMAMPYHIIMHYNGWSDKYTVQVPIIQLTTLDKNKDAETVEPNQQQQ